MLEIEVWKYWNIVEFPKISIKIQKLKTFYETQIVSPHTSDKSFSTIRPNLTEDFACFATWLGENKLIVNFSKKTENMLFGTPQKTKHLT